jgi:hypothetical protein
MELSSIALLNLFFVQSFFFSFARPKEKKQKKKAPRKPMKEDIGVSANYTKLISSHVFFHSLFSWTPAAPSLCTRVLWSLREG